MQSLRAEIEAIRTQILALQREREQIHIETVTPEDDSPQAIAQAYRRQARETANQSAELKGIDDAIAALKTQLRHKKQQLDQWSHRHPLEQQMEESRLQAQVHADRINHLARELSEEVKSLKAIADQISPLYWQVYYKPFITGFSNISVPHVRSDGEVWGIVNRIV
ncbi:hypothetical protein [Lyngbya sp. CCY1209]|uniref:hypothetical protein n=1 Tax=Lyngbya sp. CCY1209 TaxID=2886103 RepID=UPI002D208499|nr:hypothetical protein [Lyngbya sp. CCY1209]MEB3884132.1 hypothetical protein [Lyngbya sp. CCY1209]